MNLYDTLFSGAWVEQGGGGSSETVLYQGPFTTQQLQPGFYAGSVTMYETVPYNNPPVYIKAEYNGEEYSLPLADNLGMVYGEVNAGFPIFTTFPIALSLTGDGDEADTLMIATQAAETNTLKASAKIAEGGGGESDYSTCTVTLAGNLYVDKPMFAIPILIERKNGICLESAVNVYQESSEDYTVLLYKGQAVAMNQQTTSSVSGAVTKAYSAGDTWYTYTITGDCTITIGSDK